MTTDYPPVTRTKPPSGPRPPVAPHHQHRPPIVVLCGSTRFRTEFEHLTRELTLAGVIVLGPGVFGHVESVDTSAAKPALDLLHRRKIDLADYAVVINPGGYIGESTRAEIAYAHAAGKPLHYTHHTLFPTT